MSSFLLLLSASLVLALLAVGAQATCADLLTIKHYVDATPMTITLDLNKSVRSV